MNATYRVLLIDEDPSRRYRVTQALRSHLLSPHVVEINNGLHYAEQLTGGVVDVAIAANEFSWGHGVDVLMRLKRYHPNCKAMLIGDDETPRPGHELVSAFADSQMGLEAMMRSLSTEQQIASNNTDDKPVHREFAGQHSELSSSAITHEVETLNQIVSTLSRSAGGKPSGLRVARRLALTADRLATIAGDAITRADSPSGVSVTNTLLQAVDVLQPIIDRMRARILVGVLPQLIMHQDHLFGLFYHLLDNALKFRSEREPHATVRAHHTPKGWIISVSDNAMGIPVSVTTDLFALYTRLPQAAGHSGVGVGLATCARIAAYYGGTLWFESDEGRGATFYVQLPVQSVSLGDVTLPVSHNGVALGTIEIPAGAGKRHIVEAVLALPALHVQLDERTIKDIQLLGDRGVNVVS